MGKPPFETSCLKETYNRIKKNNYTIPWVRQFDTMLFFFFFKEKKLYTKMLFRLSRINLKAIVFVQHINPAATTLIKRMLHADPTQRPTIAELQTDEFFTSGYIPLRLPTTCLTVPPRFSIAPSTATELSQRRPLTAINNKGNGPSRKRVERSPNSSDV